MEVNKEAGDNIKVTSSYIYLPYINQIGESIKIHEEAEEDIQWNSLHINLSHNKL